MNIVNSKVKIEHSEKQEISIDIQAKSKTLEDLELIKKIVILKCGIVRLQNYSEDLSEPGRQLKLVREPNNKYDRWATKVCTLDGTMLGYLPSRKNQSLARLMDAGKNITVFVDEQVGTTNSMPYHSYEDEKLPLIIYMDLKSPKEDK